MTIKELRKKDVLKLAHRNAADPTPEEINKAAHTMRLFYNFASAYYNNFLINQERNASAYQKKEADDRNKKTYKKACEALKDYNLVIELPGLYPIIEDKSGYNFTFGFFYH